MKRKFVMLFTISIAFFCIILISIVYGYRQNDFKYRYKESKVDKEENANIIQTSTDDGVKISPNAKVYQKQFYKKCGHTVQDVFTVPEEIVNRGKADVEKYYYDWKIEEINNKEIHLYKENYGICEEHYVVKDVEGILIVFSKDEDGTETIYLRTQINTKYLPSEDYSKLKGGINIVGKDNLYSLLQDYE